MAPRGRGTARAGAGRGTTNDDGAGRGTTSDDVRTSSGSFGVSTPLDHLHIEERSSGLGSPVDVAAAAERDLTIVRRAPDGRIILDVSTGLLMPSAEVATALRKIFEAKTYAQGFTWRLLTQRQRDDYFEEFKKRFTWDSAFDVVVRTAWEVKAMERYKDFVHKNKKKKDIGRPDYMSEEIWAAFNAHWEKDESKAKAVQGRKNRMSEPDGPGTGIVKHTGGSRSAVAAASKMVAEGVPRQEVGYRVFSAYHKTKDGSFVDSKSARIDGEVQRRRIEFLQSQPLTEETESTPIPIDTIYRDVVGVDKKKRIFGAGSLARSSYQSSSIGSSQGPSQMDVEAMSRHVQAQVAERATEIELRMQEKTQALEDSVAAMREEMKAEREAAKAEREAAKAERERLIDLLLSGHGSRSDRASS